MLFSPAAFAFDPSAGSGSATVPIASPVQTGQPDSSVLYKKPARPLYAPGAPIIVVNPDSASATDVHGVPNYISPVGPIVMPQKPLYPSRSGTSEIASDPAAIVPPPITAYPQQEQTVTTTAIVTAPVAATPVIVQQQQPIIVEQPVVAAAAPAATIIAYPQVAMPAVATAPIPNLPPVSPEVAARANAIMAQQQQPQVVPAANAPVSTGFIAPTPLIVPMQPAPATVAVVPTPAAPVVAAVPAPAVIRPAAIAQAPVVVKPVAPVVAVVAPPVAPIAAQVAQITSTQAAPNSKLSEQTRAILSLLPSHIDAPKSQAASNVTVNRVTPEIKELLGTAPKEESFDSLGLSIKVRRPGLDANYELSKAYTALMGGDTETAIATYKEVLSADPKNQDALFGLAATYHRLGQISKAQPLYGALLKLNPNHREGLNNFLALVAQESPQDALPELVRLQQRNPDFSPIPAQIAIVMDKMGYADQAREQMIHAIELAPDNLTYRYNLAVMLDRQGRYADAGALYKQLIQAGLNGENLPAPLEAMQKRLNFITAAVNGTRPPG